MRNRIVNALPHIARWPLRRINHALGRSPDPVPPPDLAVLVGAGDFLSVGQEYKRYIVELGKLKQDGRILDVGCGVGRIAIPLMWYLSHEGQYWGFDVIKPAIDWCNQTISARFPNFHFEHSDICNAAYNPQGRVLAREYRFPYDDAFFDFVVLTSVFTHLPLPELEHYTAEISRVLKVGGTCLSTFFLLNEESLGLLAAGRSTQDFRYPIAGGLTANESTPEWAVAYNEDLVLKLFERCGLEIEQPIRYGRWCERRVHTAYQDMVISHRVNTGS